MESFGLFQLLNSLLSKAPSTEEKPDPSSPPSAPSPEPEGAPPLETSNACADFFERHEQRRRRK